MKSVFGHDPFYSINHFILLIIEVGLSLGITHIQHRYQDIVDYLGAPMTSNIVLFILILAFVYQQALSQGRLIKIKRMQLEIEVGIPWPRTFMSLSTNCLSRVWVHPNKILFMYTHSCSIPWPCTLISLCPHLVCGSASALFLFCCGSL